MRAPIPLDALQADDPDRLVRNYRVRPELAAAVVGVELARRTDLLDSPAITAAATGEELLALMRAPRAVPDPPRIELANSVAVTSYKRLTLAVRDLDDGCRRVAIEDARGDVISAELDPRSPFSIRVSSVRLLGHDLSELRSLDETARVKCRQRLEHLRATAAGEIRRNGELQVPKGVDPVAFEALSAFFATALDFSAERSLSSAVGGQDGAVGTTPTDEGDRGECGPGTDKLADLVPDLNISDCCAAHDECYAKGCTSCDKAKCDEQFYFCVLKKAGPAVATVYYDFVAAIGYMSFDCEGRERWGAGGLIAVGVGVGIGVTTFVLTGNPTAAGVAGMVGAAASIFVQSLLCRVCEAVREWDCAALAERRRRECDETYAARKERCAEKRRERRRACRNWPWGTRWLCKARAQLRYGACIVSAFLRHLACVVRAWLFKLACEVVQGVIVRFVC